MDASRELHDAALADACRILGTCVLLPTAQMVESFADGSFASSIRALLPSLAASAGQAERIERRLDACPPLSGSASSLSELRREYTRLFAHPTKPIAPLCESIFKSAQRGEEKPLLMVSRTAMALDERYQAAGFRRASSAALPPDHMEIELAFLALMLDANADEADAFLDQHLGTWAPAFFSLVEKHARTPEYALFGSLGRARFEREAN